MTKSQIKNELKKEIKHLNRVIDYKILKGYPYAQEARKHRLLLSRLAILTESTMIARSMRLVSMMMF